MELMKREGMQKLSEYLPSMKLDDYTFELRQECVDKCHTQCLCHPSFHLSTSSDTTEKYFTFKYDECLACLGYPTVSHLSTRS